MNYYERFKKEITKYGFSYNNGILSDGKTIVRIKLINGYPTIDECIITAKSFNKHFKDISKKLKEKEEVRENIRKIEKRFKELESKTGNSTVPVDKVLKNKKRLVIKHSTYCIYLDKEDDSYSLCFYGSRIMKASYECIMSNLGEILKLSKEFLYYHKLKVIKEWEFWAFMTKTFNKMDDAFIVEYID